MAKTGRPLLIVVLPLLAVGCLSSARLAPDPDSVATLPPPEVPALQDDHIVAVSLGAPAQPGETAPATGDKNPAKAEPGAKLPAIAPATTEGKVTLKPPPLEVGDIPLPINLAAALRLADARPLTVAAAQASAWVAEAQLLRAKLIWVPEIDLSACYLRHDGFGPDTNRGNNPPYNPASQSLPLNQNINWFYTGGGLYTIFPLTDAIFEPLAARQVLTSRRWDIQTAKNDALLETARAYFDVHKYRGMYAGAVDVVERGRKLVDAITLLTEELVPKAEANRAKRQLANLEVMATAARERWRVASADLTQVLRLDPRAVVVPIEHDHLQITLIDPARPLDQLAPIGLRSRPEMASQLALIEASQIRIRQEKLRPLLPTFLLTGFQTPGGMRTQVGLFGTGYQSNMNLWSFRDDFSPQIAWQLDGLGFGNMARIKERRGDQSKAIVQLYEIQDMIVAEITQTQAHLQSAAVRVTQAERALREAIANYDKNFEGLRQTNRIGEVLVQAYRPQEVVVALRQLRLAYDAYFITVADYNIAQFALFHALGYPARDLTQLWPPGEMAPVDTTRPGYLPEVGIGPPPATR